MTDVKSSNQDFLNSMLSKLHGALEGRFRKFVDEQIRAIEDTKVKINKRKGVIGFMRIFPTFSAAVENMLANVPINLIIRRTVDAEYERILKAMFDSLKVIARENPAVGMAAASGGTASLSSGTSGGTVAGGGNDPEDKEALNFHILLIENMNHFVEEVDNAHGLEVLEDWRTTALEEFNEHLGLYVSAVVRRPLGKLLEALENIESQLANGKSTAAVAAQPSNSRQAFNRVLGGYDAKEVRRGIDTLRRRIEKHFAGEGEDPAGLSRGLVTRVVRECETFYGEVEVRIERVTRDVYGGEVLFEWPRAEVRQGFSQAVR
jgi:exocyst complex component 1